MLQGIKNIYHLGNAFFANLWFGFPSRKLIVIGVTGTDGKTTTTSLIYHIIHTAGYNASMISSVGAIINGKNYDVGFHVTTPSPFALQRFLLRAAGLRSLRQFGDSSNPNLKQSLSLARAKFSKTVPEDLLFKSSPHAKAPRASGFLVLETTSHALDQHRVFGIKFDVGVLTNVTHEHLDYHKTYENYVGTKAKLLKMARVAVVNRDDESYESIKYKVLSIKYRRKVITYGLNKNSDINPKNFPFKTNLIGEFNKYNILAAVASCEALGVSDKDIRQGIESFKAPIGREEIVFKNSFTVMIDFAHTPNAFEQILSAIKSNIKGRLIHVFGSAGQRDTSKRPLMGKISSKYADIIILTAEDPRSESVDKISGEIESGIKIPNSKFQIPNRKEAIVAAIKMARKGDFVLITGKSHEKSMNYGHGEVAWDEYRVVRDALKQFNNLTI